MKTTAELMAAFSPYSVVPYKGHGYRNVHFDEAHRGRWIIVQHHTRLGWMIDHDDGVILSYKTEEDALSRCFALNLQWGYAEAHRFEADKLTGRNRVPRCIHCGLPLRNARAHPRI